MGYCLTMRIVLFSLLASSCFSIAATASQWAEVGDKQLREDVEILHDAGVLQGPVLSWPLPWEQIAEDATQASTADDISPFLQAAARRIVARYQEHRERGLHPNVEIKLQASNGASLVKDFSGGVRSKAGASARFEHGWDNTTVVYGIGYQQSQVFESQKYGGHVVADNIYVSKKLGNWIFFAGTPEEWWGPSGEQSLSLSNTARPYPKAGFKRASAEPFESRWLHWLGYYRFEATAGVLTGPRHDYQNNYILSQRLELQPFNSFQIALTKTTQICGKKNPAGLPDRKCGLSVIAKSLVLVGSANSGKLATDSSNSGASIDLRYGRPVGNVNFNFYSQFFAEDSPFDAVSKLAGISFAGHTVGLGSWKIGAEAIDTAAIRLLQPGLPRRQLGTTYLNFVYTDGFSFRGQPLGASIDGDANMVSAYGSLTDKYNRRWSGAIRYIDLNISNTLNYRISQNREHIWFGEAGVVWPTLYGDVNLKARVQSDSPNTPGRKVARTEAEAGWTVRF